MIVSLFPELPEPELFEPIIEDTASAKGFILLLLDRGKIASSPSSPIPTTEGPVAIPPVSYQLIPILGTEGGFRLNLPEILNRGIFNLGKDQLKFIKPLILSIALPTASL